MVYGGHRNKIWWKLGGKTGRWMEKLLPGGGCPGGAGCPGSRSGDERDEHRVGRLNPSEISEEFVDGNWGKSDGKLDPLKTKQIHGSKPTKSQHTNKSQKKLGAIFGWEFSN